MVAVRRLTIQELEPRLALSHAPSDHVHATLKIEQQGEPVIVPANIGLSEAGHFNPHTHDEAGELHIGEGGPAGLGTVVRHVVLEDFFDVWRERGGLGGSNRDSYFSQARIMNYRVDLQSDVLMLVNGIRNDEFERYIPHDGDEIEIQFNRRSWHNEIERTDVDGVDGTTFTDAQLTLDELANRRFSDPDTGTLDAVPKKFLDVDDNTILSALDALLIINHLHRRSLIAPLSAAAIVATTATSQSTEELSAPRRTGDTPTLNVFDVALIEMEYEPHKIGFQAS